jgi:hypothetical protein
VATLAELASARTRLGDAAIDHLQRLTASWSLLADLSFSDMLLMTRVESPSGDDHLLVIGQMRPNNRTTLINDDLLGTTHPAANWPIVGEAYERGVRVEGELRVEGVEDLVPTWCVPVRFNGDVIAALVRLQGPLRGSASLYEFQYLSVFERLCDMVSDASFPYREDAVAGPGLPRVGDGVMLLDTCGRTLPRVRHPRARRGRSGSRRGRSSFTACPCSSTVS